MAIRWRSVKRVASTFTSTIGKSLPQDRCIEGGRGRRTKQAVPACSRMPSATTIRTAPSQLRTTTSLRCGRRSTHLSLSSVTTTELATQPWKAAPRRPLSMRERGETSPPLALHGRWRRGKGGEEEGAGVVTLGFPPWRLWGGTGGIFYHSKHRPSQEVKSTLSPSPSILIY
jgi:hypothetical protein